MARPKRTRSEDTGSQSKFVQVVEGYLAKANWTKQQFMAEIQVGEAQFYRWARGENVPSKAIVNRIAVFLGRRLDEVYQNLPHNPFPVSDTIDGLLNELLEAAGYSASIRGKVVDSSWQEIAHNRSWKLGYTLVYPNWAEPPERYGEKPIGIAIDCAERVGDLLGIDTEWQYLTWQEMPLAIAERKVHGIAPFMLAAPGRFFDYRLSDPWYSGGKLKLTAVTLPIEIDADFLEDLPHKRVRLVYIENEIGDWVVSMLGNYYEREAFADKAKAFSYMKAFESKESDVIPILCSDHVLCKSVADENNWQVLNIRCVKDLELYPAFAFHPNEEQLTASVNAVLKLVNQVS
ncbi:MAG: transporter substrate-binding domain-containing protein [Microcoleus sp. PH2017_29_MFU_D_A]|uniref:transporter substrate-binding domain-containing protein n=1 Tax=unclassified Microcoleus TaxID=2642155 RepID=UPI001DFECB43|nr:MULTISPECIES: transporter substrate-binding domain-containing protein [unclassified Microcoleus]MCC3420671.1 transporter substrate-binding domain-containing protein [Microcoleus sp. PH2017_07_MST_O_A]MCC3467042.1 transporter substrate-binding domain-containing protein [Microcoleus sp. PH2017_06_SFM_O_A]MCC3506272.1 transporter substrate-binding domain-containing protein [Microcoleus sp. PH2017_19_SFW_U_A]MCC3511880.1 transporter substrate-binding domain-containing protein [Microcoleus sp. PH